MKRLIRVGLIAILLSAVLISSLPRPASAQQDIDAVRRIVQQWLLETLDKPYLVLVEYTYTADTWDSEHLGCPVEGESYARGVYNGYRWTFTFDNFVRYEVHSGLYGDPVVLCSASNVASNVPLTLYSAPAFDVLAPEAWLVFPSNDKSDVLFGPGSGTACDQAGMRVKVLGAVEPDVTPDTLLDRYLSGKSDPGSDRIPIGSFGRSEAFTQDCASSTRTRRVTMVVEHGIAYQIEQWAPESEFAEWDQLFQNILSQFSAAYVELPPDSAPTPAPATPAPTNTGVPIAGAPDAARATATVTPTPATPAGAVITPDGPQGPTPTDTPEATAIAEAVPDERAAALPPALPVAHLFLGDVFVGTLDNLPGRSITILPLHERRFLQFAPDGRTLAYINATTGQLRVLNAATGRSPRKLAEDVHPDFPPAWSPDSRALAYVVDTGERAADDETGAALLAIHRVALAGGEPELVGGFSYRDGCTIESHDPADAAYFNEARPGGADHVLAWLPEDRLLVSTGCAGGLGVLQPAEQQIIALGDDLHGGAVAPDQTRFLARTDGGLAVLDFNAWERTNIPLGVSAQQVAWGHDGQTVYYTTATRIDSRTLDDSAQQAEGEEFFGMWPVTVNVYSLALIQLDLRTDQPDVIWQGRGRGIGRIVPAPDGSGVLFSLVPSSLPLAEVFQTGGDAMAINEAQPDPILYWLGTGSTSARMLAYAGQPTLGAADLFAAAK